MPNKYAGQIIYQVDAFTETPFTGNPAAVCIMDGPADEDWMQLIAREMNLSETAFIYPKLDGWHLRWFTPTSEEDICGHATIATAHLLWELEKIPKDKPVSFFSLSGRLVAEYEDGLVKVNLPNDVCEPVTPDQTPVGLAEALLINPVNVYQDRHDYFMEVESEKIIREMRPNYRDLIQVDIPRAVIVTCKSETEGFDYLLRYFAPRMGIDEDPITGSVHCSLAPLWQKRLGKSDMVALQPSNRGGTIRVHVDEDRVSIYGKSVTVMKTELL